MGSHILGKQQEERRNWTEISGSRNDILAGAPMRTSTKREYYKLQNLKHTCDGEWDWDLTSEHFAQVIDSVCFSENPCYFLQTINNKLSFLFEEGESRNFMAGKSLRLNSIALVC